MIKTIFAVLMAMTCLNSASAQQSDSVSIEDYQALQKRMADIEAERLQEKIWKRQRYINIAYTTQSLKDNDAGLKLESKFGISLVRGKTYYMHKKPIAGLMKIGLDWTMIDLSYVKYKDFVDGDRKLSSWQAEYSMHIGPSITINPVDYLMVNVYGRFVPTFSVLQCDNGNKSTKCNYIGYVLFGGAVSYKCISLGIETRFGKRKFENLIDLNKLYDGDNEESAVDRIELSGSKIKINSTRFYVSFRF